MNIKDSPVKKSSEFLHQQNLSVIIFVLFIASFAFYQLGYFLGTLNFIPKDDTVRSNISTNLAGLVTLLGLLMAFTFSMSSERYQERKHMVVEESNQIGTAYYYTSLLPESIVETTRHLLKEYTDLRIQYYVIRDNIEKKKDIKNKTEAIQLKIWTTVAAEAKNGINPVYNAIVSNLTTMIDTSNKRNAAMENLIPESILWLVLILAALTMTAIGFGSGMAGHESVIYAQIINLAICATLYIIIDMDRPTKGRIIINQNSFLQLKDSFND
jgi:hypothetical protein